MTFQEFKEKFQKKEVEEISSLNSRHPILSVLVQTYQHKGFIKECLNGILAQETDFDFEILVGEDNSVDGTREICLEYAKNYPEKIRLFLHHRDNQIKVLGEATSNFNAFYNFFSARGKYIAFCEGDDFWSDPLKLQKQVNFLKNNPTFCFTYHTYSTIDHFGKIIETPEEINQPKFDITSQNLMEGKFHPLLLTLCFKNVFKEIPEEMIQIINVDTFLLSFMGNYGEAKYIDEILPSFYRKQQGGIWSQRLKEMKLYSKINTYKKLRNFYIRKRDKKIEEVFFRKIINTYKMLLFHLIRNGKILRAGKVTAQFLSFRV